MIDQRDVVTMKIPFPTISSTLAVSTHMYLCVKEGEDKEFVKCQSFKPYHLKRGSLPLNRVTEINDITRNPFKNKTVIDCDKKFGVSGVTISTDLRTTIRPNVCEDLLDSVVSILTHPNLHNQVLSPEEVAHINSKIGTR